MSNKKKKTKISQQKTVESKEISCEQKQELTTQELTIINEKKYGLNAKDSAVSIIIGGLCVSTLMAVALLFIFNIISSLMGITTEELLNNVVVKSIYSSGMILGYLLYIFLLCKFKAKQVNLEDKNAFHKASSFIKWNKVETKKVLICVAISAVALLMVNFFVNMCNAGLINLGYEKDSSLLFEINSFPRFLLALVFMCALPALCEELLFRGVILGGMLNTCNNLKKSILCVFWSALIFALCHQSAQQFVFPLIMGSVFGFIYLFTGNIWYSVIAHFTSNAIVCFLNYISFSINLTINALYCVIAVILLLAFIVLMMFVFKLLRAMSKNQSVFDIKNNEVNYELINNELTKNGQSLTYIGEDGIMRTKPSQKTDKWVTIIINVISVALLVFILISDIIKCCNV